MDPFPKYLTQKQAAAYLTMGPSTLEKWRISGTGPAYAKISRRVIYEIEDLDAWVQTHRRRSTSEIAAG